ncbi:stalk domain-containing protein [Paenibacillus koleovorans]|uniref:stalk domain-containing protein n=1 Tax=Paenibacillus koleovorans TaxID=121608 RepID=UPI000FD80D19|nr:stalk domain-containing protein [Paenibacillus koleovorans]
MHQRTTRSKLAVILAALLLLLSLPMTAFAADATTTATAAASAKIVAIGDDLTLGVEPDTDLTVAAPYGFVDRVYEQALYRGRATVANYGLEGLNSAGLNALLTTVVAGKDAKGSEIQSDLTDVRKDNALPIAQMKKDLQAATHITLTIGINDIGADIVEKYRSFETDEQLKAYAADRLQKYTDNLKAALTTLYTLNPTAKVYVADLYSPIPNISLFATVYAKIKPIQDNMTATLQTIVKAYADQKMSIQLVPVSAAFVGNEGLYTNISILSILPTQPGYAAMSEVFAKSLFGDNKTVVRVPDLISVVVGGKSVDTPHLPLLIDGTTFVVLREYTESLGATIDWVDTTKTAIIRLNGNVVELTIGSMEMKINGVVKPIPDSAYARLHHSNGEDKTYIPLRLMAEGLGLDVQYVKGSHSAYINL